MPTTIFGREPAVIVGLVQAFLAMLVSFHWLDGIGISGQTELAIVMGVVIAVGDLYVAWSTHQTLLGVGVGLVKALLMLGSIYGLHLSTEETGTLIAFVTVAIGFFQRTQASPLPQGDFRLAA